MSGAAATFPDGFTDFCAALAELASELELGSSGWLRLRKSADRLSELFRAVLAAPHIDEIHVSWVDSGGQRGLLVSGVGNAPVAFNEATGGKPPSFAGALWRLLLHARAASLTFPRALLDSDWLPLVRGFEAVATRTGPESPSPLAAALRDEGCEAAWVVSAAEVEAACGGRGDWRSRVALARMAHALEREPALWSGVAERRRLIRDGIQRGLPTELHVATCRLALHAPCPAGGHMGAWIVGGLESRHLAQLAWMLAGVLAREPNPDDPAYPESVQLLQIAARLFEDIEQPKVRDVLRLLTRRKLVGLDELHPRARTQLQLIEVSQRVEAAPKEFVAHLEAIGDSTRLAGELRHLPRIVAHLLERRSWDAVLEITQGLAHAGRKKTTAEIRDRRVFQEALKACLDAALRPTLHALATERNPLARSAPLRLIQLYGPDAVYPLCVLAGRSDEPSLRRDIVETLGRIGPVGTGELDRVLFHPGHQTGYYLSVLDVMRQLEYSGWTRTLRRAIKHPDPQVPLAALELLIVAEREDAFGYLVGLLPDLRPSLQAATVRHLHHSRCPSPRLHDFVVRAIERYVAGDEPSEELAESCIGAAPDAAVEAGRRERILALLAPLSRGVTVDGLLGTGIGSRRVPDLIAREAARALATIEAGPAGGIKPEGKPAAKAPGAAKPSGVQVVKPNRNDPDYYHNRRNN
jgi:hypothetical protein